MPFLMQFWHRGFVSSHLSLRFLHVTHPFLDFVFLGFFVSADAGPPPFFFCEVLLVDIAGVGEI